MSDDYEKLNKASLGFGILGVLAAIYFGISGSITSGRMEALEAENLDLQKRRASFDTNVLDGNLMLFSTGSVFSAPELLTITPIFSNSYGAPVTGEPIILVLNSAVVEAEAGSILFEDISDRICEYTGNKELCKRQNLELETLLVTFEIDGIEDTDPVRIN